MNATGYSLCSAADPTGRMALAARLEALERLLRLAVDSAQPIGREGYSGAPIYAPWVIEARKLLGE